MNIVLFEPDEIGRPLDRADQRAEHIINVLKLRVGRSFDAGEVDGPMGKAVVRSIDTDSVVLEYQFDRTSPPLYPITLVVGLPRPQTARDVLRESASLGVRRLLFVPTNTGETSYARSSLWTTGEARRLLVKGAATAFTTRIPHMEVLGSLDEALADIPWESTRTALDNYEAELPLSRFLASRDPDERRHYTVGVGSERGWSAAERDAFRTAGFTLTGLGPRVLRTETACTAAVALVVAALGGM